MDKYKVTFSHSGIFRGIADDREITDNLDSKVWSDAIELLNTWEYEHNGCKVNISVDWSLFFNSIEESNRLTQEFYATGRSLDKFRSSQRHVNMVCNVNISGTNNLVKVSWYPKYFAEQFAYDFCLMMNLSVPGSCDFHMMNIITDDPLNNDVIKLSAHNFEMSHFNSIRKKVPKVLILNLSEVINWYKSLDIGVKQTAKENIEKALFSMLHISELDGDIVGIVWVFHALESLFDTKAGENFNQLINRISELLSLDPAQKVKLNKNLRKLYNTRSSIVHGGYEVIHPINQNVVDCTVDDKFEKALI